MLRRSESLKLVLQYSLGKIKEQIKSVALISVYLILFQRFVLDLPIENAMTIGVGLALVVFGLAFFMEGLMLGLMPLGEVIGLNLPSKAHLWFILLFAFILGMGATFAEPAISVLKQAGSSVIPYRSPLLYAILNKYSSQLVFAVGTGVGVAVTFGMLRFIYNWSLKPFIFILMTICLSLTIWGCIDPNMQHLIGLAWDCGAVTTGPVTVPLVLALGIGVSRVMGSKDGGAGGFGVVTLASAFPILAVLLLGFYHVGAVPKPATAEQFFSPKQSNSQKIFASEKQHNAYLFANEPYAIQKKYFENNPNKLAMNIDALLADQDQTVIDLLGSRYREKILHNGLKTSDSAFQNQIHSLATKHQVDLSSPLSSSGSEESAGMLIYRQFVAALQAILPLTLLLLIVFITVIRERIPRADEISLGVFFALVGMCIFSIGIELGLANMGGQLGSHLAASYDQVRLDSKAIDIKPFDPSIVQEAISSSGQKQKFFFLQEQKNPTPVPYLLDQHDSTVGSYRHIPIHGPLYGKAGSYWGFLVVLLFAFIMGYGATLAEPALNALGDTVEKITIGAFKKNLLIQSVAIGVGVGLTLGLVKIIWNIPLVYLIAPPYFLLLLITYLSNEDFVNIGWDSAGVTTGPITVPLVLAMGLGIGGQSGVVEGFGILSMASVCPILSVLLVGLMVDLKRKKVSKQQFNQEATE